MILYHFATVAFYIVYIVYEHNLRNEKPQLYCISTAFVGRDLIQSLIGFYSLFRIVMIIMINTWLIFATASLSKIVRKETEDWSLTKNNRRLIVIIWAFVTAYSGWFFFELFTFFRGYHSLFENQMLWLLNSLLNYIPIFLVLFTHFRNMQSFFKMIKTWM